MIKLLNNQFRLDALVLYGLRLIHGSFYVSDAFDIRIIDHLYIIWVTEQQINNTFYLC